MAGQLTGTTYEIAGMTCEHCEKAVAKEVASIVGVTSAQASAHAGTLVVSGSTTEDEVRAAVERAGYGLAG